jgi:SAM-dependent methyltransferase
MSAALELYAARPAERAGLSCLRSPVSGQPLLPDGPHRLVAAGEAWPVIDGIAFLRSDQPRAVESALGAIEAGALEEAAVVLLAAGGQAEPGSEVALARPGLAELRDLVAGRESVGFRDAMRTLGYGPLGDEFAHRWTDPEFLAGLALAEAYWVPRARILEVGCGAGHFLRAFLRASASVTGADSSFSHLWLARHWVAPGAELVCFDPAAAWPFADAAFDTVFCSGLPDAQADRAAGAAELQRVAGAGGSVLCRGLAAAAGGEAALFGRATLFDEAELTSALIHRRAPRARPAAALAEARSVALATSHAAARGAAPVLGLLDAPARGTPLRRNPLYCEQGDGMCVRRFPSPRYAEKYATRVTYPSHVAARARVIAGADPGDDALIRRRVWVDLPPRW